MSSNVITLDTDSDSDDEIEILEFRKITQDLLDNPQSQDTNNDKEHAASTTTTEHKTTKKLADIQCPICFDTVDAATVVAFKDTIVLKLKKSDHKFVEVK
ncbi:hypothetical protein CANMA_003085 [Candida margitis]|uniref:uncharacterized protein n=1 Tax=Candida margitis TaxID=1775924 RepID=UPI002227E789|nr:uncharacterized protein CANMA_003085 [Candida margitis]KAI5967265.1 hypothetical protein CANMA_003085 [Candida margitis]